MNGETSGTKDYEETVVLLGRCKVEEHLRTCALESKSWVDHLQQDDMSEKHWCTVEVDAGVEGLS